LPPYVSSQLLIDLCVLSVRCTKADSRSMYYRDCSQRLYSHDGRRGGNAI